MSLIFDELTYDRLLASGAHPVFISTLNGRFLECNAQAETLLNFDKATYRSMNMFDVLSRQLQQPEKMAAVIENLKFAVQGGIQGAILYASDGEAVPVEFTVSQCMFNDQPAYMITVYDLREREQLHKEDQTTLMNMPLALSITRATLYAGGWRELCNRICYLLVESGRYRFAWVGRILPPSPIVQLYSVAGELPDDVVDLKVHWDESPLGQGPTGLAIRSQEPVVFQPKSTYRPNRELEISMGPWMEKFKRFGIVSAACFPILIDGVVWGSLSLYKTKPHGFTANEINVLTEIVRDLSVAISRLAPEESDPRTLDIAAENGDEEDGEEKVDGSLLRKFAGFAHDLRHPLTSFKLYLDLIRRGQTKERYFTALNRETDRMHQYIDEIMTFSRLKLEIDDVEMRLVQLKQLVEELTLDREPLITEHGLQLKVSCDPQTGTVWGDAKWLGKIVGNLLANAINYTPHGGQVTVRTYSEVRDDRPGAVVSVRDTGVGIPAEEQERIFKSFYRSKNEDVLPGEGFGLGLAIVADLTNRLNGQIDLASEPGAGSEFAIWFPAVQSQ